MADGQTNTAYTQTLVSPGGTEARTFSVTAGALPTGLTLSTSVGTISGTPTVICNCTFTITVTDANGVTGSNVLAITVRAPPNTPVITTTTLPNATQNVN